ncbi:arsenate reductase ArsC [Lacipirellula parvula]|uniref:arsenate reductase ArsC n=1 Tax=Lacipirellula parvula TaxID=2650471 RepID=UPI001260FDED|nr:arsenate reductase ArsC [Lacipirellula parvula]
MKKVLVLCTGNSCRSQMAEALWNKLGEGEWQAVSAGSKPAGYVHPMAIEVMKDLGVDLSSATSKHVEQFDKEAFDVVVTVCDNAKEACPFFPNAKRTLHWPFEDPADFEGDETERRAGFARVRDEILASIIKYLSLPGQ